MLNRAVLALKYFNYSILIELCCFSVVHAQIESGSVIIGLRSEIPTYKYSSQDLSQGGTQSVPMDVSEFDIYIMPSVSFVASRNFEMGIQGGYAQVHRYLTNKHINLGSAYVLYQGESKSQGFVYGGFLKYTIFLSERFAIPITASVQRVNAKGSGSFFSDPARLEQTISVERRQRSIRPELFYKFSERLNASLSFLSIYFMESDYFEEYSSTFALPSDYSIRQNGLNLSLAMSLSYIISKSTSTQ